MIFFFEANFRWMYSANKTNFKIIVEIMIIDASNEFFVIGKVSTS